MYAVNAIIGVMLVAPMTNSAAIRSQQHPAHDSPCLAPASKALLVATVATPSLQQRRKKRVEESEQAVPAARPFERARFLEGKLRHPPACRGERVTVTRQLREFSVQEISRTDAR
jgi:hypothetical protein